MSTSSRRRCANRRRGAAPLSCASRGHVGASPGFRHGKRQLGPPREQRVDDHAVVVAVAEGASTWVTAYCAIRNAAIDVGTAATSSTTTSWSRTSPTPPTCAGAPAAKRAQPPERARARRRTARPRLVLDAVGATPRPRAAERSPAARRARRCQQRDPSWQETRRLLAAQRPTDAEARENVALHLRRARLHGAARRIEHPHVLPRCGRNSAEHNPVDGQFVTTRQEFLMGGEVGHRRFTVLKFRPRRRPRHVSPGTR